MCPSSPVSKIFSHTLFPYPELKKPGIANANDSISVSKSPAKNKKRET
jgi:hypothetical protein